MRCEADALRNLQQAEDTEGAVRWRLPMKAREPDTSVRRV